MFKKNSEDLLARYASTRSQEDFQSLVKAYSGLVKGAALRRLNGDHATAEDVMQEAFVSLSKKADKLVEEKVSVSSWLYRQTCRLSANYVRASSRRKSREHRARSEMADSIEPSQQHVLGEVDEAMLQLPEVERALIILRYVEECDHATLGKRFGVSSDAARKRVSRAVEQLREILRGRGLEVTTPMLVASFGGFCAPSAKAGVISEISAKAISVKAGSSQGMLSIPWLLGGGLAMSIAAGGVEMFPEKESDLPKSTPPRVSQVDPSTEVVNIVSMTRTENSELALDEVIDELKALEREPNHLFTNAKIDLILSSVSSGEIVECFSRVDRELSVLMRERVLRFLVSKCSREEVVGLADWFLDRKLNGESGDQNWRLDRDLFFRILMERNAEGVSDWFAHHWAEIHSLLDGQSVLYPFAGVYVRHSMGQNLAAEVVICRYKALGLKNLRQYLKTFDEESRYIALRTLFANGKGERTGRGMRYRIELYPVKMAAFLRTFSEEPFYEDLQAISWDAWMDLSNCNEVEAYLERLPELEASEAKVAFEHLERLKAKQKGGKR